MRLPAVLTFVALAASAHAQAPAPPGAVPVWTITCSQGGRIVYLERVSGAPSQVKQLEVSAGHPGAICAYLAPEEGSNELPGTRAAIPSLQGPPGTPGDIGAALRVLRGEKIGLADNPPTQAAPASRIPDSASALVPGLGTAPSVGLGVVIDEKRSRAVKPEDVPGRLRVGVYETMNNEDVVADWMRIVSTQPVLRGYSPGLAHVDGRTLLFIDKVSNDERPGVCLALALAGMACSGPPVAHVTDAVLTLSRSYPAHFFIPGPAAQSGRIPETRQDACDGEPAPGPNLECRSSPFSRASGLDLVAMFAPKPVAGPVRTQQPSGGQRKVGPAKSMSSSGKPRSKAAIAKEAATSARIASGPTR